MLMLKIAIFVIYSHIDYGVSLHQKSKHFCPYMYVIPNVCRPHMYVVPNVLSSSHVCRPKCLRQRLFQLSEVKYPVRFECHKCFNPYPANTESD